MPHGDPPPTDMIVARLDRLERLYAALIADLAANLPSQKIAARQLELKALLESLDGVSP